MSEENLLDDLLSVATEELNNLTKRDNVLHETDIFNEENNFPKKILTNGSSCSVIHNGDTDSSDDEGNRNYENAKYSECGKGIKQLLENKSPQKAAYSQYDYSNHTSSSWKSKSIFAPPCRASNKPTEKDKPSNDVYSDPIFGLCIINPLISSVVLQERMVGREAVTFANISRYLQVHSKEKDWVVAGVIVNKSAVKTSQKGSQFCIWTLSDLKGDIKTVALFLFSSAHKQLWKTVIGTVVGILNPNVLDKKDGSKDEACLSVDNPQKVMIFGQSKDFGTCKSVKKNGESCTAIVNLSRCEFCVYHVKQEYQKCSKRSELQANFAGRGLTALRNKVLGKNEVFYAGKSYTAIPAKKSKRMEQKDNSRLMSLSKKGISINSNGAMKAKNKNSSIRKQNASRLEVSQAQRLRDLELLKKLGGSVGIETKNNFTGMQSTVVTVEESKSNAISVINKLKEKRDACVLTKKKIENTLDGANTESKENSNLLKENDRLTHHSDISNTDTRLDYRGTDFNLSNEKQLLTVSEENNFKNTITDSFCHKDDLLSDPNKKDLLDFSSKKLAPSKQDVKNIANEHKSNSLNIKSAKPFQNSRNLGFPVLSGSKSNSMIDLNKPITPKRMDKAKLNALNLIKKNGPLKKADPNSIKGSGRKRPIEETIASENAAKKSKLAENEFISDRFKKMMAATSKHLDLLESRDEDEKEKYFFKMEKKEQMEEKMANTFKVACKAVKCLQCKYTSFSASDMCKNERHPLKVFDAMKRFFKCGNCGNRIVSLDIVPTGMCKNCGSGKWEKTGMMKEKVCAVAHSLSIRGGEQTFVNSVISDSNINLLVPDD